jgi:hypothetical protein
MLDREIIGHPGGILDRLQRLISVTDIVEVDGLVEPLIVVDAINRLVMDPTNKSIIKAIAKTYTDTEAGSLFSADFIHGKGEGQILLLHGPPGTGKTLTAGRPIHPCISHF